MSLEEIQGKVQAEKDPAKAASLFFRLYNNLLKENFDDPQKLRFIINQMDANIEVFGQSVVRINSGTNAA